MASQKVVPVFLVCLVLVAAIHVAEGGLAHKQRELTQCLQECDKKCVKDNNRSFCEQKCDEDCSQVEDKGNTTLVQFYLCLLIHRFIFNHSHL